MQGLLTIIITIIILIIIISIIISSSIFTDTGISQKDWRQPNQRIWVAITAV